MNQGVVAREEGAVLFYFLLVLLVKIIGGQRGGRGRFGGGRGFRGGNNRGGGYNRFSGRGRRGGWRGGNRARPVRDPNQPKSSTRFYLL
jgi:hypothetical protein